MFKEATYQQCTASFEALCMARNQVTGHLIDNVSWPVKETIGEKKSDTSCTPTNGVRKRPAFYSVIMPPPTYAVNSVGNTILAL